MIYTYSTIFLASLIVALITLFLYRAITKSSKSAARSRAARKGTKTASAPAGWRNLATSRNLAQPAAAMPMAHRNQENVWPYREKKTSDVGTTHKVRRRVLGKDQVLEPWGW